MEFVDRSKILLGRIGVYKINFSKNLRRFQDIALDKGLQYPRLTALTNKLLQMTPVPANIWSYTGG